MAGLLLCVVILWVGINFSIFIYKEKQMKDLRQFIKTTIREFLNEQNKINEGISDNLLYSWISNNKIIDIVEGDKMYGNFKHTINNKDFYGNSFSRNKNLIIDHYRVRICVDKSLLSMNYKIIPLDGEIIHRKIDFKDKWKYNKYRDRNPKKTHVFGDQEISKDFDKHRFDEEFVLGDIKNISRYITEIIVYPKKWNSEEIDENLINDLKNYCDKHNIKFSQK